ncbi:MAG: nucleoside-binding protein [bacterium]|nr:nucleoside-binding protein [bacterium]
MVVGSQSAPAAIWSNTELHLQYGSLDTPQFLPDSPEEDKDTLIFTLQHASGWKYGDNFFFFDVISSENGGFNDNDTYGEWYSYFSPRKMSGKEEMKGAIKDIRIIAGFNWAPDANVIKYLPGIGLSWNAKGFAFLNTDFTLYIDDSVGILGPGGDPNGAPSEDDSFMVDINWAYPIGEKGSIEGHMEYIGERTNEFGGNVEAWILAQPQFRYFVSETVAIGIEYQYWMNKLGSKTDENTAQALLVWKF